MSFLSDLVKGDFGNLGTDISHDPVGTAAVGIPLAIGTAGLLAPEVFAGLGGAAAAGGIGALPAEAAAGGISALPGEAGLAGLVSGGSDLAAGAGGLAPIGMAPLGPATAEQFGPSLADLTATPMADQLAMSAGGGATGVGAGGDIGMSATGYSSADAAAAAQGGAAGGGSNPLSWLTSSLGKVNPLSAGIGAGGLLYNVLQGQKQLPTTKALSGQAQSLSTLGGQTVAEGNQLTSYIQSGTLPPGYQAQVNQALASAKAAAISEAASRGMPTDPSRNSALADKLAQIDAQGPILSSQLATQLAQTGTSLIQSGQQYINMQDQLMMELAKIDETQTQNIGKAISSFAASLGGGGTKIQIGGTTSTS